MRLYDACTLFATFNVQSIVCGCTSKVTCALREARKGIKGGVVHHECPSLVCGEHLHRGPHVCSPTRVSVMAKILTLC